MSNQSVKLDIKSALVELGYNPADFGDHYRARAIYRNGSNPTSIAVYKDNGIWNDYGVGLFGQPFKKLIELTDGTIEDIDIDKKSFKKDVDRNDDAEFKYSSVVLEKLLPHHKFYEDKGIPHELIKSFRGGLAMEGKMYQRYVFPIFDENDMVIGFSGRNMTSSDKPKWKHLGKKTNWEYPYYFKMNDEFIVQNTIRETREIVLVESIGDVLSYFTNENYNCLCAFGVSISSKLLSLLVAEDPDRIIISFNNDKNSANNSGLIGSIKTYSKLIEFFSPERIRICLPVKNDFGDMNEKDFDLWRDKKYRILNFEKQDSFIYETANILYKNGSISNNIIKNIKKYGNFINTT